MLHGTYQKCGMNRSTSFGPLQACPPLKHTHDTGVLTTCRRRLHLGPRNEAASATVTWGSGDHPLAAGGMLLTRL